MTAAHGKIIVQWRRERGWKEHTETEIIISGRKERNRKCENNWRMKERHDFTLSR